MNMKPHDRSRNSSSVNDSIGFRLPDEIFALPVPERELRCRAGGLLATLDETRLFLQGELSLPVHGRTMPYQIFVWVEVIPGILRRFRRFWADPLHALTPMPAYLANKLPLHRATTIGLAVTVDLTWQGYELPQLTLRPSKHPLFTEQSKGISELRARQYTQTARA